LLYVAATLAVLISPLKVNSTMLVYKVGVLTVDATLGRCQLSPNMQGSTWHSTLLRVNVTSLNRSVDIHRLVVSVPCCVGCNTPLCCLTNRSAEVPLPCENSSASNQQRAKAQLLNSAASQSRVLAHYSPKGKSQLYTFQRVYQHAVAFYQCWLCHSEAEHSTALATYTAPDRGM